MRAPDHSHSSAPTFTKKTISVRLLPRSTKSNARSNNRRQHHEQEETTVRTSRKPANSISPSQPSISTVHNISRVADAISAPSENKSTPPLDPTVIAALLDLQRRGSADFLATLFETYVSSAKDLMAGIDSDIAEDNLDRIRQHAHTLKSSSHNVGAVTFGRMAAVLEAETKNGNISRVRELLPPIRAEFDRVLEAIAANRDAR